MERLGRMLSAIFLCLMVTGCTPLINKFALIFSGDVEDDNGKITEDLVVKVDDEAHSA